MAAQVIAPDGRRWTVHRRWLPGTSQESLYGRFRRRTRGTIRRTLDLADADPGCLEIFGEGLVVALVVILAVLVLIFVVIPLIVAVVDLLVVVLLAAIGVAAKVLFRRPWVVEAVADDGTVVRRDVVGWRASGETRADVARLLESGSLPLS